MARNVALIVIDTLRKDYYEKYSKRLSSSADTSFNQCRAASSWSTPSHASMFTGKLPYKHGVHSENHDFSGISIENTFFNELTDHFCLGITQHGLISEENDVGKFFDKYIQPARTTDLMETTRDDFGRYLDFFLNCFKSDYPLENLDNALWIKFQEQLENLPIPKWSDDGASTLAETAVSEVATGSEPFFLFMNFMDVHRPYRVNRQYDDDLYTVPNSWSDGQPAAWDYNEDNKASEEYTDNYREIYGASIEYTDRIISDMISRIQAKTNKETSIIITSDHGQNLGYKADEYTFNHNSTLTEGVLHVPLDIINPPERWSETENRYFSQCELGELIVALARNDDYPDDLSGEPIAAEVIGRSSGYADLDRFPGTDDEFEYLNRMMRCVYKGDRKYQWDSLDNTNFYEINRDKPNWQQRIESDIDLPNFCETFFDDEISKYKKGVAQSDLDSEIKERLKELGYL